VVAGGKTVATSKSSAETGFGRLQKHSADEEDCQNDLKNGNDVDRCHDEKHCIRNKIFCNTRKPREKLLFRRQNICLLANFFLLTSSRVPQCAVKVLF
jgi:hypothetical protein